MQWRRKQLQSGCTLGLVYNVQHSLKNLLFEAACSLKMVFLRFKLALKTLQHLYDLESSQSLFLLINIVAGPSELGCNPFPQILTEISAKLLLICSKALITGTTERFKIGWTSQARLWLSKLGVDTSIG